MMLSSPREQRPDPQLYLQLGELIAGTGGAGFAGQMLRLVQAQVCVHWLELSEWTLDLPQAEPSTIQVLGSAGLEPVQHSGRRLRQPLLQRIRQMHDPLLIEFKASHGSCQQHSSHQCHVVSCSGSKRWVISFHRQPSEPAFSLGDLSQLKNLCETLLPLVEHHGQLLDHSIRPPGSTQNDSEPTALRKAFAERLSQEAVRLSVREQEVCLGLLTGGTVPEMAQRLNVKNSSVETYLKRATAKLGVSGRHGLAKWMAGAC
ncbi:helix-turn-helix transcriptional regulator [Pseudomonas sp. S36]|uniref:helix-turn-helix transcriptional regulator n=1 Tax=Pseudomonas sp. S36 TaxID=2767447 RepID=UPI001911680D|nr:helix-turn-helix transcriptional regulator [Pseudomonas sp. S36]MBK4989944.1 helix-turn-helix transcriptional regulator [Pseudomonas sp. S36]